MGQVADATSGVAALTEQVDGGVATPVSFNAAGDFSFTPSLALNGSADGSQTVAFTATDHAGNVSAPVDYTFTLNTAAPVVAITAPAQNLITKQDPTITGQVTGAASLAA